MRSLTPSACRLCSRLCADCSYPDSVDPNEPLFEAPEPAPGAPLLTETDSKFLSSFFEDMTANQYNMPSFGEGLNFSDAWLDLPPQFMGTATSFGQQDGTPLASPPTHNTTNDHMDVPRMLPISQMMPPPPPPPLPPAHTLVASRQQPSAEVLNAAATLLQNGSSSRGGSSSGNHSEFPIPRRPVPVGHLRHQPLEEFKKEGRRGSAAEQSPHDNTFTEWMFGSQAQQRPQTMPNVAPTDFQWGSDSNFSAIQGYTPDPNSETVESQHQDQMKCLECFEVNQSASNSRHNSPSHDHRSSHAKQNGRVFGIIKRQEDADAPPRKRRKSKIVKDAVDEEDDDNDDASTSTKKSARKRRPKVEGTITESSPPEENGSTGKRRKSAVSASKQSRENLSEEQKRENHIRSEQKRRTLIKDGFDDLCIIVPGLRGGGFSKSTMLGMTAEWLDDMLAGNEALAAQLASLESR